MVNLPHLKVLRPWLALACALVLTSCYPATLTPLPATAPGPTATPSAVAPTRTAVAPPPTAASTATPLPTLTPIPTNTPVPPAPASAPVPTSTLALPATPLTGTTQAAEATARIRAVETGLLPAIYLASQPVPTMTLADRMAFYKVPGVSIAVINGGKIEWARGYGVREAGKTDPVTVDTLFQAASISKPIAALTALRLVQAGKLDLDADVNTYLRAWRVPDIVATRTEKVTLRRLLNHSAGTTVSGFPGYAVGSPLPTLPQILDGLPPANSGQVRVAATPGSQWSYSGGGYEIAQLVMEDATGQPFATLAADAVLRPLGMTASVFEQPLSADRAAVAAWGHGQDGQPLQSGWRIYPELAAAGLWTTPTDLARYAIGVQEAAAKAAGGSPAAGTAATSPILDANLSRQMLTAGLGGWGLGPQLGSAPGAGGNAAGSSATSAGLSEWFGHAGSNVGYSCRLVAFTANGQGVVVMTNSDTGIDLYNEIVRAVAEVYHWPDLRAKSLALATLDPSVYRQLEGTYRIVDNPAYALKVTAGTDHLRVDTPNGAFNIYPESETVYYDLQVGLQVTFTRDAQGHVTGLDTRLPEGPGIRATLQPGTGNQGAGTSS
jgi:CubicO group peptidase (beta-lactamase class C family)